MRYYEVGKRYKFISQEYVENQVSNGKLNYTFDREDSFICSSVNSLGDCFSEEVALEGRKREGGTFIAMLDELIAGDVVEVE